MAKKKIVKVVRKKGSRGAVPKADSTPAAPATQPLQEVLAFTDSQLQAQRDEEAAGAAVSGLSFDAWLREGGASIDAVATRSGDPVYGVGVFATREISAGTVAFSVPTKLMLTPSVAVLDAVVGRFQALLKAWGEPDMPELLMCLRLCRALARPTDRFHSYAKSLPAEGPGVASWPTVFKDLLAQSALGVSLTAADTELDRWESLLQRARDVEPEFSNTSDTFNRARLEWARGMLQSRQFPGSFAGVVTEGAMCMVPYLDILNHKGSADIAVKVKKDTLDFVCDEKVRKGDQVWNNYGSKTNAELLMCYGFAVAENPDEAIVVPLVAPGVSTADVPRHIRVTRVGIPEEVIDAIEEEQNTETFALLLRALLVRRKSIKDCLSKLPTTLNFTVCKGPLNKSRKRAMEHYLESELDCVQKALDEMQQAEPETAATNEGDNESDAENGESEAAAGPEETVDPEPEVDAEETVAQRRKRARMEWSQGAQSRR